MQNIPFNAAQRGPLCETCMHDFSRRAHSVLTELFLPLDRRHQDALT